MSILLLCTPFFTNFLPIRSWTKLSNCIIYKSLFTLKVSENIKYILNIILFSNKKKNYFQSN